MKKPRSFSLCLFVFALTLNGAFSQPPSPLSYFPHAVGNVWQYRSQFTQQVVATIRFVRDSIAPNGSKYIWFVEDVGSGNFEIDSSGSVWSVSGGSFGRTNHIYRLDAIVGESWLINLMPPPYDSAKVVDIYPSLQFGQSVTVKEIEYWRGGVFWYGTRYLASGFGLVRWDIEPSDVWYLAGAIIDSVQWGTIVDVRETETPPGAFSLHQNYPNPFNPITIIEYELPVASNVRLTLFDVLGRVLSVVEDGYRAAGYHSIRVNGTELASGVILYCLEAGNFTQSKRMLLIK